MLILFSPDIRVVQKAVLEAAGLIACGFESLSGDHVVGYSSG